MGRPFALALLAFGCSATLVRAEHIGEWERTLTGLAEPVDAAFVGDELWVLERSGARIVVFDASGDPLRSFGGRAASEGGLRQPVALAVGAERVYVADRGNHRIHRFALSGEPEGAFGEAGSGPGELRRPHDVAIAGDRILVADTDNHRVQLFTLAGDSLGSIGAYGSESGSFDQPVSVAANRRGEIYVADRRNHRLQRFGADGRFLTSWGTRGVAPGLFLAPGALTWAGGRLFATDTLGARVQVFDLHGRLLYLWGHEPTAAGEHEGALHEPAGITVDEAGERAVVCEPREGRVQWFTTEGQGVDHEPHEFDHDPLPAFGPGGALTGSRLAMIDRLEATVVVFDVESVGLVRLGSLGGFGHGLGRFSDPCDVAIDPTDDSILVSDSGQRRITRFRLNAEFPADDPRVATTVRSRVFEPSALAAGTDPRPARLDGLPFEPGPIALGHAGCVWVGDARARALVRLSSQLAVLETIIPQVDSSAGFVDLTWHPAEERLYALQDEPRSLLVLDAAGVLEQVVELERPWEPRSLALAPNGDVFVADGARQAVIALRSGKQHHEFGTPGWQAGEFAGIDAAFPCDDRLYVLDRRQRRGQILTRSGRFLMAFGHGH